MKVEHRPGRQHQNADGVSRIPCTQCDVKQETGCSVNAAETSNTEAFDLRSLQDNDRDISLIKGWLDKEIKPDARVISMESYFDINGGNWEP